ncbi:MAG: Hsp20/alpha crystallin family protein [Saprospiraceae bacterium]|nr:Hsp20/alpha crystallin family protein [Saprospiraceae bacterium]
MHTKFRKNPNFSHAGSLAPIFSNLFHEVINTPVQEVIKDKERKFATPAANIVEHTDKFEIFVALPGFSKSEIQIQQEKQNLVIKAEKAATETQGKLRYQEFGQANFKRIFILSDNVNKESITATFNTGILSVSLQKAEKAKSKTIEIL